MRQKNRQHAEHTKNTPRERLIIKRELGAKYLSHTTVKIAWQENDSEKAGPDWLEAKEKGKGQHLTSSDLEREETIPDMTVTEKNVSGHCEEQN